MTSAFGGQRSDPAELRVHGMLVKAYSPALPKPQPAQRGKIGQYSGNLGARLLKDCYGGIIPAAPAQVWQTLPRAGIVRPWQHIPI